jgi:sigma-B regulation protein RsbU (phosphoserine phosphatase)
VFATPPQAGLRQLRDEVERAARVQRSLLPDVSVPVGEFRLASLYRPCETLGGDFYDLAWRPDCAMLLVADVMGHGVEAAMVTMLVKAAFQETAESTGDPGELLTQLDTRLNRIIPEYVFVAATVVRLELEGPEMRLANAGLPYAFVLSASERRVAEVRLDGRPLGLLEGQSQSPYDVRRLSLAPADVLLIASDGIGSVESARGECFEDRRLRQVLVKLIGEEARTVIDRLAARAVAFARGRPLRDDINLIAVSRNGRERMSQAIDGSGTSAREGTNSNAAPPRP